ncbi:MAG TPA: DNA-binding protein YbiB, partial [Albitalea sp.]|nr:DNA-binding protein YbiB [Albitalea sp.]
MSITAYIKEIGRGKEGARSLSQPQAYDLISQVLDGRVTDLEIGAFAMAMRIKGESTAELTGFLDAVQERCIPLHPSAPMVVLPSYNGARKLPNLTTLLALLLAQEGVPVLVHGPARDPGRV